MNDNYLDRLKKHYQEYPDRDSMLALADVEEIQDRARELSIYREQPKTQEIISMAMNMYRDCILKLTDPKTASGMTDFDRAYCFACMDWCMYTLDIVGENPENLSRQADEMVEGYARKVGFIPK